MTAVGRTGPDSSSETADDLRDNEGNYLGKIGGPSKHRTVRGYRAWCDSCEEWCYPSAPCGEPKCCAVIVASPGVQGGDDEALAETLRTATVVRVHHGNPDAYAEAWSDGWDEAHRQQVGGTETREWAVRQILHQLQVGLLNRQPLDVLAEHLADSVLHEGDLSGDDEARLAAVLALHRAGTYPTEDGPICQECSGFDTIPYPCPTVRAAGGGGQ